MGNNNIYERLFKLWAMVCKLILDGKREPEVVADLLQTIVDSPATQLSTMETPASKSTSEVKMVPEAPS